MKKSMKLIVGPVDNKFPINYPILDPSMEALNNGPI